MTVTFPQSGGGPRAAIFSNGATEVNLGHSGRETYDTIDDAIRAVTAHLRDAADLLAWLFSMRMEREQGEENDNG